MNPETTSIPVVLGAGVLGVDYQAVLGL